MRTFTEVIQFWPALLTVLAGTGAAQAAGFYIKEQSVTGLGRSFAGEAAIAEDASTIYFNPAGMTELPGPEAQAGIHLLIPNASVDDRGSTATVGGITGPVGGSPSSNPYDPTPVPNAFAAYPFMNRNLWVGLGITAPFGIGAEYPATWFGRYDSIESELRTINIAPSVAYRVNDWISVGAGLDIQYADAEISSAVFTGFGSPDIIGRVEGDDWSVGYNVGVLFKPIPPTRIGIHYRSQVNHRLEGEAISERAGQRLSTLPATAKLDLPNILSVGVTHEVVPKLTLLGSFEWYGWQSYNEIRIVTPGRPDQVTRQNYENTIAVAAGAQYAVTDALSLRVGAQYDETPTVDGFRSTRTPDGDRYWLTAGASYDIGRSFSIDVAYAHIFVKSEDINVTRPGAAAGLTTTTRARASGDVDIISAALRYRF